MLIVIYVPSLLCSPFGIPLRFYRLEGGFVVTCLFFSFFSKKDSGLFTSTTINYCSYYLKNVFLQPPQISFFDSIQGVFKRSFLKIRDQI